MSKKTVLITGTNPGGIGNSLARAFKAQGLRVFATARDTTAITDLASIGIETLPLEITNDDSILTLQRIITEKTEGKLDYLVNNAGRNYTIPALDMDVSEARAMFEVNVFGVMRMCQVFAPLLIEAKGGTIIQIGSCAGVMPYIFGSSYNASKAALHSYTDALKLELEPFGVNVVTVVTGGVKSRIARVDRILPDNSLYKPIEQDYNRRQKHSQEVGVSNEVFANRVVKQVLLNRSTPPRRIWEGNLSWVVWFACTFLPYRFLELAFMRMFKVWKLKEVLPPAKR